MQEGSAAHTQAPQPERRERAGEESAAPQLRPAEVTVAGAPLVVLPHLSICPLRTDRRARAPPGSDYDQCQVKRAPKGLVVDDRPMRDPTFGGG